MEQFYSIKSTKRISSPMKLVFLSFVIGALFMTTPVANNLYFLLPIIFFYFSLNPLTSAFWIVATQVTLSPSQLPLTLTQLFILIWTITNIKFIITKLSILFKGKLLLYGILLLIVTLTGFYLSNFKLTFEIYKNIIVIFIAYKLFVTQSNPIHILLTIGLATLLAALPFYFEMFGIPYLTTDFLESIKGVAQRGGQARFAGTSDYNFIGVNITISFSAFYLYLLSEEYRADLKSKYIKAAALFLAVSVPAILVTLSRGAFLSLLVVIVFFPLLVKISGQKLFKLNKMFFKILLGIAFIFIPLFFFFSDLIISYIDALIMFQQTDVVNESVLSSRDMVFSRAIEGFISNPFTGFVDKTWEPYNAHNNYLDFASYSGIFGLLFYIIITIIPFIQYYKSKNKKFLLPFFSLYITTWLLTLLLSAYGYKTFWLAWALMLFYSTHYVKNKIQ